MFEVFLVAEGLILYEFIPEGHTVSKELCTVKSRFIGFIRGREKEQWIWKNDMGGGIYS
jgi:hypothetical protein